MRSKPEPAGDLTAPTWITPDRTYELRNGDTVVIEGQTTIKFGPGHRFTWVGVKGKRAGAECVWDLRGRFSDEGESPLDIVSVYRPSRPTLPFYPSLPRVKSKPAAPVAQKGKTRK
jgi:hypothetical protein